MALNNKTIGKNIAKFRKLRDLKASEVAEKIGLKEAAYTKYERGQTAITVDHLSKISEVLEVEPTDLLAPVPGTFINNVTKSPMAFNIKGNSTLNTCNEKQMDLTLKLMESVISINEKLLVLMEKKGI
jgi:transcriptional regulator with XRE-family HTH domain